MTKTKQKVSYPTFIEPMVKAILAGLKTETCRIIEPQPRKSVYGASEPDRLQWKHQTGRLEQLLRIIEAVAPLGGPGDLLHCREAFRFESQWDEHSPAAVMGCSEAVAIHFEADGPAPAGFGRYRPARFMPGQLSRLKRRIVSVTARRIQDMTDEQAIAEGVKWYEPGVTGMLKGREQETPLGEFQKLWDSINSERSGGAYSWASNPFVLSYKFEVL